MDPHWELPFTQLNTGGLPVFRQNLPHYVLFYAPGCLAVTSIEQAGPFEQQIKDGSPDMTPPAMQLRRFAEDALSTWERLFTAPFAPLCLTLYLNNRCNLACTYCFSSAESISSETLNLEEIRSAAAIVLANCRERSLPFTVVFHGGGEPTLDQALAESILEMLAEMTGACNVPMFRYIATNGAMPAQRARWMAAHFDLIGLSCDGPAEIQSQQRPLSTGKNSTSLLERAARLVHEAGKPLDVRVTLTAETIRRQPEIAEYICQQLHPHAIHVEVVYQGGRAQTSLEPAELGDFIDPFLQAQGIARGYGIAWETSGSRLAEIHGPYCNVLRNVINLVPGGAATACLKISRADQVRQMGLLVGENDSTGHFSLDATQIETQRRALSVETARCATCFNRFHCVRSCPDTCLLEDSQHISEYRCQLQRLLTTITLQAAAARLWSAPRQSGDIPLMVFRKLNLAR